MNAKESLQHQLTAARITGWRSLVIFAGNDCKWCEKLKIALKAGALARFCLEQKIQFGWVLLAPKAEDIARAASTKTNRPKTIREEFDIKSIPTAVLFDQAGKVVASTEFIDAVTTQGESAYIDWIKLTK